MDEIKFVIDKKGDVSLEVSGAKGLDCEQITACFEQALGTKTKVEYKPEDFVVLDGIEQYVGTDE